MIALALGGAGAAELVRAFGGALVIVLTYGTLIAVAEILRR